MAALIFFRLPPDTRNTVWAEDGSRFLTGALNEPMPQILVQPYAGYLHLVPRLAAWLATVAPTRSIALALNVVDCAVVGVIAAVVYASTASLLPSGLVRAWLALTAALLPVVGVEVAGTAANLHWFFLWGLFWVAWHRARGWTAALALALFTFAAAMTEIQSVLLLPLALAVQLRRRGLGSRWSWAPVLAWAVGDLAQIVATLSAPRPQSAVLPAPVRLGQMFAMQVLLPLLSADQHALRTLLLQFGWLLALLVAVPLAAAAGYALVRANVLLKAVTAIAGTYSVALFTLAVTLNPESVRTQAAGRLAAHGPLLTRYGLVPSLLLVSLVAVAAQTALSRKEKRAGVPLAGLAVLLVIAAALNFQSTGNRRDPATSWPDRMASARAACALGARAVHVPVSPTANWSVLLPCRRVLP